MARVIGVRFRDNGKIYYFASEQFEVEVGQNVIVETARGVEYGRVVLGNAWGKLLPELAEGERPEMGRYLWW